MLISVVNYRRLRRSRLVRQRFFGRLWEQVGIKKIVKELWMVESIFRTIKSILADRPIFHKYDETIRGHVFCSFLALLLMKELQTRMSERGWNGEWDRLKLTEAEIAIMEGG